MFVTPRELRVSTLDESGRIRILVRDSKSKLPGLQHLSRWELNSQIIAFQLLNGDELGYKSRHCAITSI